MRHRPPYKVVEGAEAYPDLIGHISQRALLRTVPCELPDSLDRYLSSVGHLASARGAAYNAAKFVHYFWRSETFLYVQRL